MASWPERVLPAERVLPGRSSVRAAAERARSGTLVPETVTLESVEVRAVVEHA
jgi:hypothetical protein